MNYTILKQAWIGWWFETILVSSHVEITAKSMVMLDVDYLPELHKVLQGA